MSASSRYVIEIIMPYQLHPRHSKQAVCKSRGARIARAGGHQSGGRFLL
jgi:hypothetical protein